MNSPLAVFVAHSGKTVELAVGPKARVEAVQQTLADLTGITQGDQILMCEGARLDGARQLSAYGLPWAGEGKVPDVFLYSRAHLRADAPLPPPEALPECPLDLSGLEGIRTARHRLDSAGSPLRRALPDYQRQFQEHLLQATARHEASQQRMATCARLVSEQEVQALSIDAATANVEAHYAYICDAFQAFMQRYAQQAAAHADVLARFESDLRYLASVELHPALHTSASSSLAGSGGPAGGTGLSGAASATSPASSAVSAASAAGGSGSLGGAPTLLQLVEAPALREAAAAASRGHAHFSGKVGELEGLFAALKAELEALFMQAPSVDLEALTRQLEEMHGQVDDQASIVAALSSDLGKVAQLVEQAGEALASDPAASVQVSDAVHMLETMHETHVAHLLPRVAACHEAVEAFADNCLACKNALTRDVFSQLRTISSQQSKIREMKNRLALFREALSRQEASVQELLVVRRVPAAYKQALAECVRREAFMEKYAHSAAQLAERMGAFREKELAMRDAFRKHVERLIPAQLLERMGLLEQPPHCQVSVSAAEGERLLPVTVDDVRRIQLPWSTASLLPPAAQPAAAASPTAAAALAAAPAAGAAGGGPSGSARGSREASAEPRQPQAAAEGGAAQAEVDITASLQLENAKLRAELASQIALDCIRSAQLAAVGGGMAGLAAEPQQQQQQPGSAGTSGQASPALAQSLAASSAQASSSMAGARAGAAGGSAALPPDAAQRFERALAAKDGLVAELQVQLSGARQQAASYEARIRQLEEQLGSMAAAADGRSREPLMVGSGLLAARSAAEGEAVAPAVPAAAARAVASEPAVGAGSSQAPQLGSSAGRSSSAGPCSSAASGSSGGVSLPASPSAQQAGAAAAMAAALSASVDAATGSSLAGYLHSADSASRSLGPSSSLDPPAQQVQQRPQLPPPQQQQQPEQQPAEQPAAEQPAPAGAAGPAAAAAAAVQTAPSADQPAAEAAAEAAPQEAAAPAAEPAEDSPAEAAPLQSDAAAGEAAAAAGEAAPAPQPSQPDTAAEAASAPQPPQLLASMVLDEGSDVEGIEPASDSEYESGEEQPPAAEQEQPPAAAVGAAEEEQQQQQQHPEQQQQPRAAADAASHPLAR